jgi:hypothetical protein
VFRRSLALEEETAVFILVNFADLVLTAVSFYYGASEMNPIASWFLQRFDMRVLAFYKFALVTLVILICQYIYPTHPKSARAVLIVGSVAYGVLVAYVLMLLFTHVFSTY